MFDIVIYKADDNSPSVEIKFTNNNIWLNQKQIAAVFGTEVPAVNKHIKNILKEGELIADSTISKMEIVQQEGQRKIKRIVEIYDLDMIISVGYRVNSSRATQFRIWATQRLKDYLVEGYSLNQKRLGEVLQNLQQLEQTVSLIKQLGNSEQIQLTEAKGLLDIITNYTHSFILLNQYDSHRLQARKLNENITYEIEYNEALTAINELKEQLVAAKEATNLFGNPKDESFKGILGNIVQTFGGQYLYPSIEEQAANLLYFIIKNHPFSDGNKRIGAFIFIWFLEKNKHRFKKSGEVKINDNALVALALLVAQSDPAEKELMVQLIVSLIANN